MSKKQYLINQIPIIIINISGILMLTLFLVINGNDIQVSLLITIFWLFILCLYLSLTYIVQKIKCEKLINMIEKLDEKYLIAEIMDIPYDAKEQVYYDLLKISEKSMLEKIGMIERERKEYKEFIESWLHEIKTPITAVKLICENNPSLFTKNILVELEKINQYTEQALYYARSEYTEKDYIISEVKLSDVIHQSIGDNKYLLRQNNMSICTENIETCVYTDGKWLRFIINQVISNSIKYKNENPSLYFYVENKEDKVILSIKDNGIGILKSDLPRVFEKGFTGYNGRIYNNSTGLGLYLCKALCDKLGIGLSIFSDDRGTIVKLTFQINDFIIGVHSL